MSDCQIKKISEEEVQKYIDEGAGYYHYEFGACIGDAQEVIVEGRAGYFLIPASEIERNNDGESVLDKCMVKLSAKVILAIGGLPETEAEQLAKNLKVSLTCAYDILYLRTRSRWTQKLENELIQANKNGEFVNMNEFGVTKETQAKLWWNASKEGRMKNTNQGR